MISFKAVNRTSIGMLALACGLIAGCGDVVFETDPCKLDVAAHSIQFHTYQTTSWGQSECNEIPVTGAASLSVVFPDKELREMATAVSVYPATNWGAAQRGAYTDSSSAVLNIPSRSYPSGVISLNHEFSQPGYFVNVVTLRDEKLNKSYVVKFPFRVASDEGPNVQLLALVLAGLCAIVFGAIRVRSKRLA